MHSKSDPELDKCSALGCVFTISDYNYTEISSIDQSRRITQTLTTDDGPLYVSIIHDIDTDTIQLFNFLEASGFSKSSFMVIEPDTSLVYASYDVDFDNYPSLSSSGHSWYDSSYFTQNMTVSFDGYTGLDSLRESDEKAAASYYELSLVYLDIIMGKTNSGYTLSDLGFTNF